MGKSSKKSYSSGTVNVNGRPVSSTTQNGGKVYSNYYMSDIEKQIYDFAQNSFWENMQNVNTFDENTQAGIQKQLNAYTNQGKKLIDEMYTPMIDGLKTDIAGRFGNFDNSSFMDGLNKIEDKRSDSMSDLSQDIMSKQNELYNNELSNRYGYLSFLNGVYNNMNGNMLNFINGSTGNNQSGYNYNASSGESASGWKNYSNLASGALSFMGPYGQMAAGGLQIANKFL